MNIAATEQQILRARRSIMRSTTVWLPIFSLFAAGAVFFLVRALTDDAGAWVGFAILGLIALLMLPLLVAALQDLRAAPIETEGPLTRKWSKSDFFIVRGYYVLLGKRVFRVDKTTWLSLPEPPGRVHLLHYPHTNTLIDWQPVHDRGEDSDDARTPAARAWRPLPSTPPAAPPAAPSVEPPAFGERFAPAAAPTRPPAARPDPTSASEHASNPGTPPATPLRFDPPGRVEPPRFGRPPWDTPQSPDGPSDHA